MKKSYIRDQLKLGFLEKLTAESENLDYCQRVVEEIRRRNYAGLTALSTEYGISLAPLYHVLEINARKYLKGDRMPRSCEIVVLELMLSSRADEMHLVNLSGERGLSETEIIELYFLICNHQPGESEIKRLNELIDSHELKNLRDYIWDQGLHKFFNARYRTLKGIPEAELSVKQVAEALSMTVVFDEVLVVKSYVEKEMKSQVQAKDIKEELYCESTLKNSAFEKIEKIYRMFDNYPCDFGYLREAMLDLDMNEEVAQIETDGISMLKDYVRSKSVIGAHELARCYEFVCPVVSSDDMDGARRAISSSFLSQASKSNKGKTFLHREALYNLRSGVRTGRCYRLSSGHLICVFNTEDQGEHYLFGYFPSHREQDTFVLKCLSYFYLCETYQAAVIRVVKDYINSLSGNIHLSNALKKIFVALPLGLGLGLMIGIIFSFVIGGIFEAFVVGGGILLIGVIISGKNGYDEEITPASHERIPDHVNRHHGKNIMGPVSAEVKPEEKEEE
jgi:hypothetical protein